MSISPDRLAELAELKDRIHSGWTYHDVIALAIARAESTEFETSNSAWSKVISNFQEKIEGTHPQLLDGIFFDTRNPSLIYSGEIEGFFAVMRRSGTFSQIWTQGSVKYRMSSEAKQDITNGQSKVLQPYEEVINQLSLEIDEKLSVA